MRSDFWPHLLCIKMKVELQMKDFFLDIFYKFNYDDMQ